MIIYRVINKINGKVYIGQTINTLSSRKQAHIGSNKDNETYFHNAIRKYGVNNFKWEELCCCFDIDGLNLMEIYFIALYDSMNTGYNLNTGGSNALATEETKKKLSEAGKAKIFTKEHRKNLSNNHWDNSGGNHPNYGKHPSDKTKEKMREGKLGSNNPNYGKHLSTETRKKMSESTKGAKHPMYGKHHSEKSKQKIRETHIGKKHTKETKKKISEALVGIKRSEATKKRMRNSRLKYLQSLKD